MGMRSHLFMGLGFSRECHDGFLDFVLTFEFETRASAKHRNEFPEL